MKPRRKLRPDLESCALEDRVAPVVPNLGVIVLTTSGYILMIPFPGAMASLAGPGNGPGGSSAPSVGGTPLNLPFFMLGGSGISSAIPGNITGFPSIGGAGPAGSTGPSLRIDVGSGANDASAPVIPMVTRNTVANDALNPPPLIGGRPDTTASLLPPPPAPAAAPPNPPPTSPAPGGPAMPPPGSSLSGPFLRFPSMFPGGAPPGLPGTPQAGTAPGVPALAPPGYGPGVSASSGGP